VVLLTGLTVVALGSRLYYLGQAPLTGDEVATADFAAERMRSVVNPAYYALTVLSFKLLGVSELSARLPAMLFGVLSVPVFFITWRNLIGRNAALIGSLLIIFSGWHLYYSQFSRFYTGVFLFGSLSYYLFYQALLRDDLRRLAGALIAATVGFLFHATVVMVPVACAAYAVLVVLSRGSAAPAGLSRRVAITYLAFCVLSALATGAILWNIWHGRQSYGVTWGDSPRQMLLQILHNVQLPLAVAAFFGLAVLLRRNVWLGVYFLVGIGLPAAFVIVAAAFLNSRSVYLFYALPLIIVLAAVLCEETRLALASRYRVASYAPTLIVLATLTPEFVSHYTGRRSLDVRDAVAYVERARRAGDVVISFRNEFDYYAREKFPVMYRPGGNPRVARPDWPATMDAAVADHGRAWVVVDSTRAPLARDLESWLSEHGALVWRRSERRFDYLVMGYEIYRVNVTSSADAKR
jgi:hypothetical protein